MPSFPIIFWIDASSAGTILQGLKGICLLPEAKSCMLDGSPESALHWIGSLKVNYAMVFDNADALSPPELEGYFPPGQRGNILITSRNPTMQCLTSPESSLEVTEMEENEAIILLLKASCLSSSSIDLKAEASNIVKELCCLPLAVDQAGAFIASGASDIGDYLDKYLYHRESLLSHSEFTGASKYNKSVYGTWELSYKEIQKRAESDDFHKSRAAGSALFLLALFPFLHHESINEEIFSYAATQKNRRVSYPDLPLAYSVLDYKLLSLNKDGTWDNFIFKEGVRVLWSFCLIKKGLSHNVHSMHPLVHAWGIDRMTVDERQRYSLMAFATLSASLKNNGSQSYGFKRTLVTHVRKNIQYNNNYFDDAYEKFGLLLSDQGYSREAEKLVIKVLNARNKVLGEEHPATIMAKANLAYIYRNMGKQRHTEAEKLGIEVLYARIKIFGEEHPATITAKASLASTYRDLGKHTEAEKLEIEVLHARNKNYGEENPVTLAAKANLAFTYSNLGKYMEAKELQIQVLDATNKIVGAEHPNALRAKASLACTYGDLGNHTEAEKLEIEVLHSRNKIFGAEHPNTIRTMGNLALTYCSLGRYREAEKLQAQVLHARNKIFGDEHLSTIRAIGQLASTYRYLGKYTEAEKLEIQVLDARNKVIGEEHPDTFKAMGNLALTYSSLGRYTEAEELQIQVLHATNKILGEKHPDTILAMENLACMYRDLGNYTEAEIMQIEVLHAGNKIFGAEHPNTIRTMGNLALTYCSLGRYREAEKLQTQVLHARSKMFGEEHPDTIKVMGNLASTYRNLKKPTEAEKLEIHVLDASKKILGEEHPDTILAMENLASTYSNLGKYTEAEQMAIQVLDASSKIIGGEHPNTIRAMRNLAAIQKAMSQSMKVDNAEDQVFNPSHGVYVTQGMEGENVDVGFPHMRNRVQGEDDSDAVEASANLPPTTDVDGIMIYSQKKGI